ncbi:uncharacterized protein DNG_01724 [Cephalotrichum gorgonifer]|uniref:Uncharacterized protein n=1 Tax=Cephalotrichum gorgonifer TaxID=2041049 RepID=A0AAE8MT66_9PEZI|nr:uncharacterized protein DNG_01724 [Cephalotrichum gorgonifer]
MSDNKDEIDPYAFDIQLNIDDDDRDYRRYNDGDETQRPDILDDRCDDLLLMARIDRIVHGTEAESGKPATLIVFGFRFHGINEERRFREAIIDITFRDEQKRHASDPEVTALWPNGDFTLGDPTEVQVEESKSTEAGADAKAGGGGAETGGRISQKWERRLNYKKTDRSTMTGSIVLDTNVRKFGKNNGVRLTIAENSLARSGLVTDLRAAVLLRRQSVADNFLATVRIEAKAHFFYNAVKELRKLSPFGRRPADPVKFVPGVQYLRPPTLAGFLEAKLAEKIDEKELNAAKLDSLAGALGTTVLATS